MVDKWSGLADLLANLIEKYASDIGLEDMPDPASVNDIKNANVKEENCSETHIAIKISA